MFFLRWTIVGAIIGAWLGWACGLAGMDLLVYGAIFAGIGGTWLIISLQSIVNKEFEDYEMAVLAGAIAGLGSNILVVPLVGLTTRHVFYILALGVAVEALTILEVAVLLWCSSLLVDFSRGAVVATRWRFSRQNDWPIPQRDDMGSHELEAGNVEDVFDSAYLGAPTMP